MKEGRLDIPFDVIMVSVVQLPDNNEHEVILEMSEHTFDHAIVENAQKRGLSVYCYMGEALRLWKLWDQGLDDPDRGLYLGGRYGWSQEIISI